MNALRKNYGIKIVALALGLSVAFSSTQSLAEKVTVSGGPAHRTVWYGLSTDSLLLDSAFTAAGVPLLSLPSISVLVRITDRFVLQSYFMLAGVKILRLGAGASAKVTVAGGFSKGFHVGGGFGMGDMGSGFYTNIAGMAGFHFEIVNDVLASVDTGLRLHLGGAGEDFAISGSSNLLGLSLHFAL